MANNENLIPIPGRLHSVATEGHVSGADEIYDDTQQKDQATINSELISAVGTGGSVDSKIATAKAEIIGDAATDYNTLGKLEDKIQAETSRAEGAEGALDGRIDTLEDAVGTGGSVDSRISAAVATETTRAQAAEADRYTKSETYSKTELNNLITTPNQEYVSVIATAQTTAVTDVLPATGAADTTYRVGNWDGTQYNDSVFSEYAWDGSAYIKLSTKSQVGEVYDISVNHADTKYADLAAALGTNGANIPQSLRKGGMSVKFVQSSDNKYVQARLMHPLDNPSTAAADFANVKNWQGVDSTLVAGSHNLAESGAAELLNHPYSNPVVVQDAANLTAESSDESSGTCIKNEDNSFTIYKIGYGTSYGYIGEFSYDKDQENYLCLDYTLTGNVDSFYIVLRDKKSVSGHIVGSQQIFKGSGTLEIPLSNTYQGKYIVATFASLNHNVRLTLSNVRIVADNRSTIKENFDDVRIEIGSKANSSDVLQALARKSEITKWPRIFGKDDYDFKGLSEDGKAYIYIYEVGSRVHLNAMIDSPYIMWSAICDSTETAKLSASNGTVFAGNGNYRTRYRWGSSSLKKGFLVIKVSLGGWTVLTTEDVTAIEESIDISLYSIEDLAENIDNRVRELERDSYTKNDFERVAITSEGSIPNDNNPTRLKFIMEGAKAKKLLSVDVSGAITAVPSASYAVAVFKTLDGALKNTGTDVLQSLVRPWATNSVSEVEITSDGVLSIYFKKLDNSAFTYTEIKAIESNLDIILTPADIIPEDEDSVEGYDSLPINEFISSSSTLVSAASITCVPRLGVTYKFVLPDGINARFAYGASYNDLTNYTSWSVNGESVTIPNSYISQRLQLQKSNGDNISVAEIQEHISSGTIKVLYDKKELSVIERNYESEQFVKAMMYRFVLPDSAGQGVHSLATLVHISDLHGDVKRFENAVEYAKMLGADAVISSGDNVMYAGGNGTLYMKDVITKYGYSSFLNCIGNHETQPAQTYDNTALFNSHISPYVERGNYKADESTAATMPYYYVDLVNMNLRIITLNQFDSGCYYGEGCGGRLGQTQVTWFCNTLLSTPADYGVVIVMHANEDQIDTPETMNAWNQTVTVTGTNEDTHGYCHNGLYVNAMRPIKTIVDAFIDKTALSTTYDENTQNGNTGETVTIDVDFSNVNSGVEFICYLTGHRHKDNIGYVHTATNKQLMLNVVTSNCHYPRASGLSFAEGSDIPRGDSGVTQDAFNVYAIDRRKGVVKIARVGSSVNFEGIERRFLIAPYKD